MDKISTNCMLPDLSIGEVIYVENMGAYTIAASSNFNGFTSTECKYILN
jgi:diaminopimelate decarboxylase